MRSTCIVSLQECVCSCQSTWHFVSTLYDACSKNVMSLRCNNDCIVDCPVPVVHTQLLQLRSSVDAVCMRTQLPSVTYTLESDLGDADPRGSSVALSKYPVV